MLANAKVHLRCLTACLWQASAHLARVPWELTYLRSRYSIYSQYGNSPARSLLTPTPALPTPVFPLGYFFANEAGPWTLLLLYATCGIFLQRAKAPN